MKCPYCQHSHTKVIDSRTNDQANLIRRRRQCENDQCNMRFTTHEQIELKLPTIVKKNGMRVKFSPEKLQASMELALRKRPISTGNILSCVANIRVEILRLGRQEIPSYIIGEFVMKALRKLDTVAYVRYSSVYRNFADLSEFSLAIREAKKPDTKRKLSSSKKTSS